MPVAAAASGSEPMAASQPPAWWMALGGRNNKTAGRPSSRPAVRRHPPPPRRAGGDLPAAANATPATVAHRSVNTNARKGAPPTLLSAATMVRTVFAASASDATLMATAPAREAGAVPAGTTRT
jgi:hypothetical protein